MNTRNARREARSGRSYLCSIAVLFGVLALPVIAAVAIPAAGATNDNAGGGGGVEVRGPAHQDVSPALRTIKPRKAKKKIHAMDEHEIPPPVSTG
ncbi:MAG TPA: hypothetical protein VF063_01615, partial [Gaiellaceae bacterium]